MTAFNSKRVSRFVCVALGSLALQGCRGAMSLSELAGTYNFSSIQCEEGGETYEGTMVGVTNVFTLSAEGVASQTLSSGACEAKMNATATVSDGKLVTSVTSVDCAPDPCDLSYTISVPGLGNFDVQAACPGDFGGGVARETEVVDGVLIQRFESGPVTCQNRFVRQ